MAESKVVIWIMNFIGIPLYGYTLFINLDNVKGWILLIIASLFGVAKLFFYCKRSFQAIHKEQQEAALRDLEFRRKMHEAKAIELKLLEEELSLRITGLTNEERKNRNKN